MMRKYFPLIISLSVLYAVVAVLLLLSIDRTGGELVYSIDDPYIHMAMAKNFSQHFVWGITRYGFTSSSSSPMWTLLLSGIYYIFGVSEVAPFVLNLIFATILIFVLFKLLYKFTKRLLTILIALLAAIFIAPLPTLVFCGQEHILHILFALPLVFLSTEMLSSDEKFYRNIFSNKFISLLFLAFFATAVRYESMFIIFTVAILFILRKKFLRSALLLAAGTLPIIIYGIISLSKGWHFLPNSILLKGNVLDLSVVGIAKFLYNFFENITEPHIVAILAIALFILFYRYKHMERDKGAILLVIFIASTLLHTLFARMGWFFRYEAYLMVFGLFAIAVGGLDIFKSASAQFRKKSISKNTAVIIAALLLISPLAYRAVIAALYTPLASKNIFEQQYRMGLFLKEFYQGECIVANDVGAINFLADIKCLDMLGLASLDVANLRMAKKFDTKAMRNLSERANAKIAILYDTWFQKFGGLPPEWEKVEEWKIRDNIVCGEDIVSFFAVQPSERENLIANLERFRKKFPQMQFWSNKKGEQ